jgi:hypothetical protein
MIQVTPATRQRMAAEVRRTEPGRCKCGHKMHSLKPPHACWQHEVGTCSCTEFQGVNGELFSENYFRGGTR